MVELEAGGCRANGTRKSSYPKAAAFEPAPRQSAAMHPNLSRTRTPADSLLQRRNVLTLTAPSFRAALPPRFSVFRKDPQNFGLELLTVLKRSLCMLPACPGNRPAPGPNFEPGPCDVWKGRLRGSAGTLLASRAMRMRKTFGSVEMVQLMAVAA